MPVNHLQFPGSQIAMEGSRALSVILITKKKTRENVDIDRRPNCITKVRILTCYMDPIME